MINKKISLKGLLDGKKSSDNLIVNDLPNQNVFIEQKKLEPATTKSTFGLLGFEGDNGDLLDRITKSQDIGEEELIKKALDENFGTIQVPTRTDGGVQTRNVNVGHEFASTFNQAELSKMSAEEKQELDRILERLGNGSDKLPIHQLTDDNVRDPQGTKNPQAVVQGATGLRAVIDNINSVIGAKMSGLGKSGLALDKAKAISGIKSKIPTGSKGDAQIPESAKTVATSVNLDNPFEGSTGIGQFA